jgi:hypothetical protein
VRTLIALAVLMLVPTVAVAGDETAKFRVSVKKDGREIASPSFRAKVGQPASIRIGDDLTLEALAKPVRPDGRAWTKIRITYSETEDAKFIHEMHLRHASGSDGGSFEYTDPLNRRYFVQVIR